MGGAKPVGTTRASRGRPGRIATAALITLLCLGGCTGPALRETPPGAPAAAPFYTVRAGDTLYSIAVRHGLDYRDVARWNQLGDGSLIYPGQRLRLAPGTAADPVAVAAHESPSDFDGRNWDWPTDGPVVATFGSSPKTASGIHIGGRLGQPVRAAAAGEVVYAGSGLQGYGKLVIVRHDAHFLSAYGHNETLIAREGERVSSGQTIASLGRGPGQRPLLHFEIRRDGEPVDPLLYLPAHR